MEIMNYNIPLWLIFLFVLIIAYVTYMSWDYNLFKRMGVKGPTPVPVFGNLILEFRSGLYRGDPHRMEKYGKAWGIFQGKMPNFFVTDEEMLSQLFVKKFSHFNDRFTFTGINEEMEYSLTDLKGEDWKRVRNLMTPTFSAGKMKKMTAHIQNALDVLLKQVDEKLNEKKEIDMKGLFGGFTMDVVCSTAFGIKTNAQRDPNDPFVKNASKLLEFDFSSPVILLLILAPFLFKPLGKIVNLNLVPNNVRKFFREVVVKEINNRKAEREDYVDFIQLMIQAHENNVGESTKGMSFKEILGNSLIFFFAGYETTATTLSMFSYNMALHPDIQEKVYEEIVNELGEIIFTGECLSIYSLDFSSEQPDYDNVNKLVYLEMCINETMRLYPPVPRTERECTSDTDLTGIPIRKGLMVTVPIWAIHRSAKIWPDPETFNPERFSAENKQKHSPFHFLPFGYGPRNCIGMRLALLELKIALSGVMRQFYFTVCDKTQIPPKLGEDFVISPKDLWLTVNKR